MGEMKHPNLAAKERNAHDTIQSGAKMLDEARQKVQQAVAEKVHSERMMGQVTAEKLELAKLNAKLGNELKTAQESLAHGSDLLREAKRKEQAVKDKVVADGAKGTWLHNNPKRG